MDKCPDQPGPATNQGCPVLRPELIQRAKLVTASVLFETNSAKLTSDSYSALGELADSLKANPHLDLLIEGHTDNIGNSAYNLKLSEQRAESVKKVLVSQGISASRIRVKGFGDTQPIASNESYAGRAANRRVVFIFQLKNR
jgi:outer membrane protein OmpA-like peptidoglycan-associated protein